MENNFDVIVLGGGPAGISAALWCDDLGLTVVLVEPRHELGGQLLWIYNCIENHLGSRANNGREMRDSFVKQIENRKVTLKLGSEISRIDLDQKIILLKTDEKFTSKAIIIATGIKRRTLNIQFENEFLNKGIIESGRRDYHLVQGKNIAVVGGGDAALENALILVKTARKIWLIHRRKDFSARKEFVELVSSNTNIEILTETTVENIIGHDRIEAIEINKRRTNEIVKLPIDALMIRIGVEPNTELFLGKVTLDENGYINIDSSCKTNVRGIFAIGDVANSISPTISTAVGMGATAAKSICYCFNQKN